MSAYQIVVLNTITQPDSSFQVSGVFALTAPSNAIVPIPGFASRNPYIDEPTLLALQDGSLVEQDFISGFFPVGTSLATVQTSLQALFTAAQAALNSTNPALSSLVGTLYTGVVWAAAPVPSTFISAPTVIDFNTSIMLGRVPGAISGRSQGYVLTASTTNQPVLSTTYLPPGVNGQRSVASSSANDTAAGTGARQIQINYLDAAFVTHSELVTLNGVTAVATVGTNIAYIESIVVTQVGSGQANLGTISLFTNNNGTGAVIASAAIGDQGTMYAHHYVPAGVTCYVLNFGGGGTVVGGTLNLVNVQSIATPNAPPVQIGASIIHPAAAQWDHDFELPLALPGPAYVYLNELPLAVTANKTLGGFEFVQF